MLQSRGGKWPLKHCLVPAHWEPESFLGYLGKTQVGFKCSEGWGILSAFNFCIFNQFLTTSVSIVAGLRSTKNLLFVGLLEKRGFYCWMGRG